MTAARLDGSQDKVLAAVLAVIVGTMTAIIVCNCGAPNKDSREEAADEDQLFYDQDDRENSGANSHRLQAV